MFFKKLKYKYIWERIFVERLCEPIHLNLLSFFIYIFGNLEQKINFDLKIRFQHAYCLLEAAKQAKKIKKKKITVIEFGVANGAGLLNIQKLTKEITKYLDIEFEIFGFDLGKGLPEIQDYRDHPELYSQDDFPMNMKNELEKKLDTNVHLVIGDIKDTLLILNDINLEECPIGFLSFDMDLYSSTKKSLQLLNEKPGFFLPIVYLYFDDLEHSSHNSRSGELLAIKEFNDLNDKRFIEKHTFLKSKRIFQRARWIDHVFFLHILDHEARSKKNIPNIKKIVLENPYL